MFQRLSGDPATLPHLRRIESAVRARFGVPDDALVLVREERTRLPGVPARETLVRFWIGHARYRLRVFKPLAEVGEADLPVAWLLPGLVDDGDPDCC
ncbi:hypothetical protein ROJ8625_03258 [Roseivivax jejudonensis]|uniref:Uncharacterized protein n=1 Tax=Roseivivax jejudonensis TaxID=1529041 RepID=A0A1X6ZXB2_9RHOB|nr:hypothetical protein [Roseivivax jejudonensis]SLN64237.1 hypothetical protein ROJ8625_03258 [Roseivivax jejudonensis]